MSDKYPLNKGKVFKMRQTLRSFPSISNEEKRFVVERLKKTAINRIGDCAHCGDCDFSMQAERLLEKNQELMQLEASCRRVALGQRCVHENERFVDLSRYEGLVANPIWIDESSDVDPDLFDPKNSAYRSLLIEKKDDQIELIEKKDDQTELREILKVVEDELSAESEYGSW